jgi:hypothetical protein
MFAKPYVPLQQICCPVPGVLEILISKIYIFYFNFLLAEKHTSFKNEVELNFVQNIEKSKNN